MFLGCLDEDESFCSIKRISVLDAEGARRVKTAHGLFSSIFPGAPFLRGCIPVASNSIHSNASRPPYWISGRRPIDVGFSNSDCRLQAVPVYQVASNPVLREVILLASQLTNRLIAATLVRQLSVQFEVPGNVTVAATTNFGPWLNKYRHTAHRRCHTVLRVARYLILP